MHLKSRLMTTFGFFWDKLDVQNAPENGPKAMDTIILHEPGPL